MAHPNLEVLERMDAAMIKGDTEAFFGSYTDDVVVYVGGTSPLAGDHHGLGQLQALFGRFLHFRDGKISEFWYVPLDQADLDAWFAK